MDSELVNQFSVELGHLFQQRMEALKANALAPLTPAEAETYAKRRERICQLCGELARGMAATSKEQQAFKASP